MPARCPSTRSLARAFTHTHPPRTLAHAHHAQEELATGRAHLPREAAILSQLLSPDAISTYRWGRPPGALVFGCAVADDDALDRCEDAGLPISPSMLGPHADALATQLQVFFKHNRFPEHKAFIL
jgi:hypothetical protein